MEINWACLEETTSADKGKKETEKASIKMAETDMYLQIKVNDRAEATFNFSEDGKTFREIGGLFVMKPGRWVGAKIGMFYTRTNITNDAGFADIDWFRIE